MDKNCILIIILAMGVFGIINTEMGIVGILPAVAERFSVDIVTAGELVWLFALGVAIAGPTMPLLFSGMNRKAAMLLVLGIFLSVILFLFMRQALRYCSRPGSSRLFSIQSIVRWPSV